MFNVMCKDCDKAMKNYELAINNNNVEITPELTALAESFLEKAAKLDYPSMFSCLEGVSLPDGKELCVKEIEGIYKWEATEVCVKKNGELDGKIFNHIKVSKGILGAWEAFLLYSVWHVLPLFDHALYSEYNFLISESSISKINFVKEEDQEKIIQSITPFFKKPEIAQKDDHYYVTCRYWCPWEGLAEEIVEIVIDDNQMVTSIVDVNSRIKLLEYRTNIYL